MSTVMDKIHLAARRIRDALQPEKTFEIAGNTAKFDVREGRDYHPRYMIGSERPVLRKFLNDLDESDIVWDVGANFGPYSVFSANIADTVVAFEPHPEAVEMLERNRALNEAGFEIREYALGSETTTQTIETSGTTEHHVTEEGGEHSIKIETADSQTPTPTVVKIDVEGYEADVIDGAGELLDREKPRLWFIEIHPTQLESYGREPSDVIDRLHEHNYEITELQRENGRIFIRGELY